MEAEAEYDFEKTSEDELSFRKGDILKVGDILFYIVLKYSKL